MNTYTNPTLTKHARKLLSLLTILSRAKLSFLATLEDHAYIGGIKIPLDVPSKLIKRASNYPLPNELKKQLVKEIWLEVAIDLLAWRDFFTKWSYEPFATWDDDSKSTLDSIFNCVRSIVAGETVSRKRKALQNFARIASQNINRYPMMVHPKSLNYIPAKPIPDSFISLRSRSLTDPSSLVQSLKQAETLPMKEEDNSALLWSSAIELGQTIAKAPQRLKYCRFCFSFFWDEITKPGNMRICGKQFCKKEWNAERAKNSYANRKKIENRNAKA